jgi:retron-type reverse transcriptase
MKRINNLYQSICSIENLQLADEKARKRKAYQYGVKVHDRNKEVNIQALHDMLVNKTYKTSPYTTFKVYEPKERLVFRLPYFPDRITHHAVMNILEPIFLSVFTADTYSCIKGKGIHAAANGVKSALKDVPGTKYCLKLDITKFYPSVDHDILKSLLRRKIKDRDLLWLLDEIIDSAEGLPIGNYLSQYLANFYLTYFDHWLKEVKGIKYYFRYADDLVILSDSKEDLHILLKEITIYLSTELNLQVKGNWQIFPVESRGIDFVGYVFFHTHTRLRKSIKKKFSRKMATNPNKQSVAAYYGWAKHANCNHLLKKLCSYEQLQGFRNNSRRKRIQGRQNKTGSCDQPGNKSG